MEAVSTGNKRKVLELLSQKEADPNLFDPVVYCLKLCA